MPHMPTAYSLTAYLYGLTTYPLVVEADIRPGLPDFKILGLSGHYGGEARERIHSAIRNSNMPFPKGRVTINISPSSLPKHGTGFDLAIALAILRAGRLLPGDNSSWVCAELNLKGDLCIAQGLAALVADAPLHDISSCIVPRNAIGQMPLLAPVLAAANLSDLVILLRQGTLPSRVTYTTKPGPARERYVLDGINGQSHAKRSLVIALAGGHHLFITGPPGTGKSMLAQAASELVPPLTQTQTVQVMRAYSTYDQAVTTPYLHPPFRSPHHSISRTQLLGSSRTQVPGELSLAQHGILFLDEFSYLANEVRESLREPLQQAEVRLASEHGQIIFPADCLVIAAQNHCPCGLLGVPNATCTCLPGILRRYKHRVSGPLLDRFSLFCQVEPMRVSTNYLLSENEKGHVLASKISQARELQYLRNGPGVLNGSKKLQMADLVSSLPIDVNQHLEKLGGRYSLSARSQQNLLKVARTCADLAGETSIALEHVQEAAMYRYRE